MSLLLLNAGFSTLKCTRREAALCLIACAASAAWAAPSWRHSAGAACRSARSSEAMMNAPQPC